MGSAELGGSGEHRIGEYGVADLMKVPLWLAGSWLKSNCRVECGESSLERLGAR